MTQTGTNPEGTEKPPAARGSRASVPSGGWAMFAPDEQDRASGGGDARTSVLRWLARGSLGGLAISVVLHVIVMLLLALITVNHSGGDAGGAGEDGIEFALGLDEAAFSAADAVAPAAPSVQTSSAQVQTFEPLVELADGSDALSDAALSDLVVTSASGGQSGPAAADPTLGSSSGSGSGASFFGLEAQGKRFAYVVDVSSSMRGDAFDGKSRIAVTKSELARSVSSLIESGEYLVMLYAGDSAPLHGRVRWTPATESNKLTTRKRIGLIDPTNQFAVGIRQDGTRPMQAFRKLFTARPRPDAIYFMTDGDFRNDGDVPAQLARLNARYRIPIHCILFLDPDDAALRSRVEPEMLRIARDSGGRYTLVGGGSP